MPEAQMQQRLSAATLGRIVGKPPEPIGTPLNADGTINYGYLDLGEFREYLEDRI